MLISDFNCVQVEKLETVSRDGDAKSTQTRILASSSIGMIIRSAPYIFLSNTLSTKAVGMHLLLLFLILLLASILVCVLFATTF